MPELICNTSPLQYLHQLDRLSLLPRLAGSVIVPDAVAAELAAGETAVLAMAQERTASFAIDAIPASSHPTRASRIRESA